MKCLFSFFFLSPYLPYFVVAIEFFLSSFLFSLVWCWFCFCWFWFWFLVLDLELDLVCFGFCFSFGFRFGCGLVVAWI
jgi:hypothetical protein